MNRLPVSQQLRDAATRIACRVPLRGGVIERTQAEQVISDAWRMLDLADAVEQMEMRLRPMSWRERRAARLGWRLRLRAAFARAIGAPRSIGG